jgi:hypothetical protein
VKEDPEYHWMVCHLIQSFVPTPMQPSCWLVAQGASQLESHWGLQDVVAVCSDKKPSDTGRSGELRFYFYTSALRHIPVS